MKIKHANHSTIGPNTLSTKDNLTLQLQWIRKHLSSDLPVLLVVKRLLNHNLLPAHVVTKRFGKRYYNPLFLANNLYQHYRSWFLYLLYSSCNKEQDEEEGGLKYVLVDRIQTYFGEAIRRNINSWENMEVIFHRQYYINTPASVIRWPTKMSSYTTRPASSFFFWNFTVVSNQAESQKYKFLLYPFVNT